ncbi:unnamed protein product, partial [Sphagnum balticum]
MSRVILLSTLLRFLLEKQTQCYFLRLLWSLESIPHYVHTCFSEELSNWEGGNQSSGFVSAEFGLLSKLNILSLALNNRIGQIPGNLSLCYELQVLNLQRNQLWGTIPSSFGSPASSISGLEWEPT